MMGARGARALALWCALLVCTRAVAYTVDCNHEYADCDTELSKLTSEDEEGLMAKTQKTTGTTEANILAILPSTSSTNIDTKNRTTQMPIIEDPATTAGSLSEVNLDINKVAEPVSVEVKPKPRLLNLNIDELQNFANALHNASNEKNSKKHLTELSDVNLDGDDDEEPRIMPVEHKTKDMPDKFYTNLQAPFHSLLNVERGSEEMDTCKENEIVYKIGDRMDRGCDETCECSSGGIFDCSPRCKHPYIRRGRRLNDPLCFESPVDECCSIIACATGTGGTKVTKLEVCRYENETHTIGSKWNIGCEQTCTCETNSVVNCKPRCNPLPVSDKCINVQDPNDACCEVQVCDVSHDAHEEPENQTSTTSTTTEVIKGFEDYEDHESRTPSRPLVLAEPIGSVKVLQNNSVQVNLMHMNNSEDPIHLLLSNNGGKSFSDVELKYSNLILNLEGGKDYILKTKETGTKFNFTITASDTGANEVPNEDLSNITKIGCYHDGQFYGIGEEFHIGCEQLCECIGQDSRECAAMVCPSHVGLELVSKGCVRWAPSPPAQPPNCCPRSARCLSDGTCHYKGVAVPNWSEVPIALTGCEERCFCENGELDCQEVCSPLPPVPPQHLRCPPNHRPAAVNISDDDCCKQWGCMPNAGNTSTFKDSPNVGEVTNYVTPLAPVIATVMPVLPMPPLVTDSIDFHKHKNPIKSYPKYIKIGNFPGATTVSPKYDVNIEVPGTPSQTLAYGDNSTIYNIDNIEPPLKTVHPPLVNTNNNAWKLADKIITPNLLEAFRKSQISLNSYLNQDNTLNHISNENVGYDFFHPQTESPQDLSAEKIRLKSIQEPVRKVPISKVENFNYFLPSHGRKRPISDAIYSQLNIHSSPLAPNIIAEPTKPDKTFFEPVITNQTVDYYIPRVIHSQPHNSQNSARDKPVLRKQVTILKTKDMKKQKQSEIYSGGLWNEETKAHVLTKLPSPYETVLLKAVPNAKIHISSNRYNTNSNIPQIAGKTYTALNLEHLLNQMEVESVVNKNLGRSADNGKDTVEGQPASEMPPTASHPPFLPTVSPNIHFPQEEIDDYDRNNIHHPANPIEPPLVGLPPGLTLPPAFGDNNKKLSVISLQADSPTSVKMLFGLPTILVGLRGSVDLRYTDKAEQDISTWNSQVFAPADEILTTPRLEFRLTGLKPSTVYKIRGKLYLHNLPVEPESEIYSVQTQDLVTSVPVEEKRREIDSRLTVTDVNDTTTHVSWRHFDEEELQYIDGIQVRYRPVGTPIYSMTELLHHSRSAADLHELRPNTKYEASLVLVPPPKSTTELVDPLKLEFTTSPHVDPYNWNVTIETRAVGAGAAEVWWHGVPAPAERWVRVYRAAHACNPTSSTEKHDPLDLHGRHGHDMDMHGHDHDRQELDAFRLAARDLPPTITITGLVPDTKCRIWLEMFLTNGKVKTSNVLEINTKSLDHPEPVDNEIASSSVTGRRGDYYGALVGVGAVAALGALSSLLLLLVVLRRHRPRSVAITSVPSAPRESSLPPYDNPAYKLELQQETMDL